MSGAEDEFEFLVPTSGGNKAQRRAAQSRAAQQRSAQQDRGDKIDGDKIDSDNSSGDEIDSDNSSGDDSLSNGAELSAKKGAGRWAKALLVVLALAALAFGVTRGGANDAVDPGPEAESDASDGTGDRSAPEDAELLSLSDVEILGSPQSMMDTNGPNLGAVVTSEAGTYLVSLRTGQGYVLSQQRLTDQAAIGALRGVLDSETSGDIYKLDPNGRGPSVVTEDGDTSPGGRWLVGTGPELTTLVDVIDNRTITVAVDAQVRSFISPDGEWLIYMTSPPDRDDELVAIHLDSAESLRYSISESRASEGDRIVALVEMETAPNSSDHDNTDPDNTDPDGADPDGTVRSSTELTFDEASTVLREAYELMGGSETSSADTTDTKAGEADRDTTEPELTFAGGALMVGYDQTMSAVLDLSTGEVFEMSGVPVIQLLDGQIASGWGFGSAVLVDLVSGDMAIRPVGEDSWNPVYAGPAPGSYWLVEQTYSMTEGTWSSLTLVDSKLRKTGPTHRFGIESGSVIVEWVAGGEIPIGTRYGADDERGSRNGVIVEFRDGEVVPISSGRVTGASSSSALVYECAEDRLVNGDAPIGSDAGEVGCISVLRSRDDWSEIAQIASSVSPSIEQTRPDGRWVNVYTDEQTTYLLEVLTGRRITTESDLWISSFSPDGRWTVAQADDGALSLADLDSANFDSEGQADWEGLDQHVLSLESEPATWFYFLEPPG